MALFFLLTNACALFFTTNCVSAAHQFPSSAASNQASTPSSEPEAISAVARYLCLLGDKVQEDYSQLFDEAFNTVMMRPVEELTYSDLQNATEQLVDHTTGWTKVMLQNSRDRNKGGLVASGDLF